MADRGRSPPRAKTPSIRPSPPLSQHSKSPSKNSPSPTRKHSPSQKGQKSSPTRKQSPSQKGHSQDKSEKGMKQSPKGRDTPQKLSKGRDSPLKSPKGRDTPQKDSVPKDPSTRKGSSKKGQKSGSHKSPELTDSGLKIVDYSGQGMTSVPVSLLSSKDIGELCLASNNLRSIPLEIRRLVNLTKLDLSRNGIRCSSPQDFGGLPSEMEQLKYLVELRISECNLPFIPPAIWRLTGLRILDISRNKINILLPDIGNLVKLQWLNLQQTNISSLPPEIAFCQDLEEVLLWGNCIESLPETLPEMPKLRTMAINYRSFCGVVDDYMENLLRKGQIKSEHIPVVVFELPSLECLDLECTKLNNLPDVYNLALKEFYLCRNFLQTIPVSIYNLKYLSLLDLSNNLMIHLPEDIGRLRSLQVLKVSNNMFERVPSTIGLLANLEDLNMSGNRIRRLPCEISGLKKLRSLVLSHNNIQSLPGEICQLVELETLDLTDNAIRQLPMKLYKLQKLKVAHSYRKFHKHGLWVYKNPLEQPPPQVWRTEKTEDIYDYLKKLAIIKTENLQRQKILVLGASQSGKTCLANVLAFRKSCLTNGEADKTRVLHQMLWKTDNNVEFMLNDFGGDDAYQMTTPLFLDSKALVLLVYNCATFREDDYRNAIGQWLSMLNTQAPGAVVKIIASQCDLIEDNIEEPEDKPPKHAHFSHNGTPEEEEEEDGKVSSASKHEEADRSSSDKLSSETLSPDKPFSDLQSSERPSSDKLSTDRLSTDRILSGRPSSERPSTNPPPENTFAKFVVTKAEAQLKHYMKGVKEELDRVTSEMTKIENSMSMTPSDVANDVPEAALKLLAVRRNKLREIQGCPVRILPDVAVVSASDSLEGIAGLVDDIEHLAIDRDLFPHAQRCIPGHWDRFCMTLKKKKCLYLLWDEVEQMAEMYKFEEQELKDCIHYLNDIGDVLWYEDIAGLSELLFHRPLKMVDVLAALYRHDMDIFMNFAQNKIFRSKGDLSEEEFVEVRESFLKHGEVCRPLLKSLWFYQKMDNAMIEDLLELLPLLDLCYAVPEPSIPTSRLYCRPMMIIPWYNQDPCEDDVKEFWREVPFSNEKDLTVIYSFPLQFPVGLFQKISAVIQDLVLSRTDWKDAVYATSDQEQILLKKDRRGRGHFVQIFIRGVEFSSIQSLMHEFVQVINCMLIRYPGLYWTLDIPMKNHKFLSFVAKSPTIQFELFRTPSSFML